MGLFFALWFRLTRFFTLIVNPDIMPKLIPQLDTQRVADMADVFISYSRKDIDFVQHLHQELESRNREPWVDWRDIPPTAEWLEEVYAGIEAA